MSAYRNFNAKQLGCFLINLALINLETAVCLISGAAVSKNAAASNALRQDVT